MDGYQALLLVSFGGPERAEDVKPFLRRVTAGRDVPESRIDKVAEHYYAAGGVSPLPAQCRALLEALRTELAGTSLEIYWGNRNWHPLLEDTLAQMRDDGRRAGPGVCDFGLRGLQQLPAVPRRHRRGPSKGRAAGTTQWKNCASITTTRAG